MILAGYAIVAMGGEGDVTRETVSRGLSALAAELDALGREEFSARLAVMEASSNLEYEIAEGGDSIDHEMLSLLERKLSVAKARQDTIQAMRARLDLIGAEIRRDGEDWDRERDQYERTQDRLATIKGRDAVDLPLLSVVAAEIIDPKDKALGKRSGYAARLRRAVRAFVAIVGDKSVDQFSRGQLTLEKRKQHRPEFIHCAG